MSVSGNMGGLGGASATKVAMTGTAGGAPTAPHDRFRMELLMERLRTKNSHHKTLRDISKAVRMTMLDKRWALDAADRAVLQKCLDSLQHRIKVCSLQSLVERLECLSRQLGLKFAVGSSGVDLFISSDMFYLEIILEPSGAVKDVKIHHEGKIEQQSCEELVSCISRGDFQDFTMQLEGLTAIYQLNAQKNIKCKAYTALTALETDLGTLSQLQTGLKDLRSQVHKNPIGFVQKRRGGHAMKLVYFVSPYDVAGLPGGALTAEALANGTGHSALLSLESAAAHRLQLSPLVTLPQRIQPNSGPSYSPLGPNNSATLPARFILKLSKPTPICASLLKMIIAAGDTENSSVPSTNLQSPMLTDMKPFLSLVASQTAGSEINSNKGLFVTLPDQNQCYFLTETQGLDGNVIESIPFTHPSQVPPLIACLRQQALFNTLISSCVRPSSKQDVESSVMIEITALSCQHISIALEQPGEGGMATLELELPEGGGAPRVSVLGGINNNSIYEEYLGRVLQRTLSIPLTVRALLARWEKDSRPGFSGGAGGIDSGGPPTSPRPHYNNHTQNNFINDSHQSIFGNQDGNINTMLGNGNNVNNGNQNSQIPLANLNVQQSSFEESKVAKKRKSDFDSSGSNKRSKPQVVCEVLLESSSSNCDSAEESEVEDNTMHSNSSNDEEEQPTSPNSQTGFASDLELSGLDPTELIGGSSNDNKTSCSEFSNSGDGDIHDIQEMDEMIRTSTTSTFETKNKKQKSRENREHRSNKINTSSLLMELEGAGYMPPSVSITPITSSVPPTSSPNTSPNFSSALTGMGLDRRPGIEIIPISTSQQTSLSSSVTIIPIPPSQNKSMDDRRKSEKKSTSSSKSGRSDSSDRSKEKKKKKRREDSMGPPDKLPPKQDPLTKPVSVSIKPTDRSNSPLRPSSPNSLLRKFSPSPTHGKSVSVTKSSGSPNNLKSIGKSSGSSSHHSSPRHSPVQCSPKHSLSGYSSPKNHGTSSPKHSSSSGSSGKPSMSTLKSATSGSPSSKSSSSYDVKLSKMSASKDSLTSASSSSKDKDKKSSSVSYSSSSGSSSPKLKSSSVKLKQLEVTLTDTQNLSSSSDSTTSPIIDLGKSTTINQVRNRKGSLSAVIDKLKSAQHCGSEIDMSTKSTSGSSKDRMPSSSNRLTDSKTSSSSNSKLSDNKTQEYMVKPSSDGMKITINKTRTKDTSSSSSTKTLNFSSSSNINTGSSSSTLKQFNTNIHSASSTGSPKTHTGLKPGVISGPASKKPQVLQSSKSGSALNSSGITISSPTGSNISNKSNSPNTLSSSNKIPFTKSNSSSCLSGSSISKPSSKSTGSPKMSSSATDLSKLSRDRDRDREKQRSNKSSSLSSSNEKSIFGTNKSSERRLSPAPSKDDVDGERAFKSLSQHKEQNFVVESLTKSLDTSKYQIPKLSARTADDSKTRNTICTEKTSVLSSPQSDTSVLSNRNSNESSPKILDYMSRSQEMLGNKYSFQHLTNTKTSDQIQKSQSSLISSKPLTSLSSTSPKAQNNPVSLFSSVKSNESNSSLQTSTFPFSDISKSQSDNSKDIKSVDCNRGNSNQPSSIGTRDEVVTSKGDYPKVYPAISICNAETINQSYNKQLDASISKSYSISQTKMSPDESRKNLPTDMCIKSNITKSLPQSSHEPSDILLDFSSTSKSSEMKNKIQSSTDRNICVNTGSSSLMKHVPPMSTVAQPPSLSVRIVKSPAPSPLMILSPHSNSPCITDDELMDEAVVGPGK